LDNYIIEKLLIILQRYIFYDFIFEMRGGIVMINNSNQKSIFIILIIYLIALLLVTYTSMFVVLADGLGLQTRYYNDYSDGLIYAPDIPLDHDRIIFRPNHLTFFSYTLVGILIFGGLIHMNKDEVESNKEELEKESNNLENT